MEASVYSLLRIFFIIALAVNAIGFLIDFLLNKKPLSLFIAIGSAAGSLSSLCCIKAPDPQPLEAHEPIAIIEEKGRAIVPSAPPLKENIL